jgi:hypothetical protein
MYEGVVHTSQSVVFIFRTPLLHKITTLINIGIFLNYSTLCQRARPPGKFKLSPTKNFPEKTSVFPAAGLAVVI